MKEAHANNHKTSVAATSTQESKSMLSRDQKDTKRRNSENSDLLKTHMAAQATMKQRKKNNAKEGPSTQKSTSYAQVARKASRRIAFAGAARKIHRKQGTKVAHKATAPAARASGVPPVICPVSMATN